jgi:hypothetical protein
VFVTSRCSLYPLSREPVLLTLPPHPAVSLLHASRIYRINKCTDEYRKSVRDLPFELVIALVVSVIQSKSQGLLDGFFEFGTATRVGVVPNHVRPFYCECHSRRSFISTCSRPANFPDLYFDLRLDLPLGLVLYLYFYLICPSVCPTTLVS